MHLWAFNLFPFPPSFLFFPFPSERERIGKKGEKLFPSPFPFPCTFPPQGGKGYFLLLQVGPLPCTFPPQGGKGCQWAGGPLPQGGPTGAHLFTRFPKPPTGAEGGKGLEGKSGPPTGLSQGGKVGGKWAPSGISSFPFPSPPRVNKPNPPTGGGGPLVKEGGKERGGGKS